MDKREIAILGYEHDGSRQAYSLDTLGKDFEINVPPENIYMAICAHHQARKLIEEGIDASILTVGGSAVSNKRIVDRINEITEFEVVVEADNTSNSIASNIQSLTQYESPFIIICQKFNRLRTYIHSRYHLKSNFEITDWETYIQENEFSEFESSLIHELGTLEHIPLQRVLVEGVLIGLAYLDPKNGLTTTIASLRQKLRNRDPKDNIFNRIGFS